MTRETILVTDSLFIDPNHVKKLRDAGYDVIRLDKPKASEDELKAAIKGKVGYILGGIEKVTSNVIDSADSLKAIVFTGSDYKTFVPGADRAAEKGIMIANAPGANAYAVAEFILSLILLMERNMLALGRVGQKSFLTSTSLRGKMIGVIGAGNVATAFIGLLKGFQQTRVCYTNRTPCVIDGATYSDLDELLSCSDVVVLAVSGSAGQVLSKERIAKLKPNALVINVSPMSLIDIDALYQGLKSGAIRAAIDWPAPDERFTALPLETWYHTNDHTAYNTYEANNLASDMAVESLLNLLRNGKDKNRVL